MGGLGAVELKRRKGVGREGWGQEEEPPRERTSYCCNPP